MNKIEQRKKLMVLAGLGLLFVHFILTNIYCLPDRKVPLSIRQASNLYSVPFFHQGWQLFAPNPPRYQGKMRAVVMSKGKQDSILVGNYTTAPEHYRVKRVVNRLSKQLASDMSKNLYFEDDVIQYDVVQSGTAFKSLVYFIGMQEKIDKGVRPDSIQLIYDLYMIPMPPEDMEAPKVYTFPWFEI
ncbi:MAG: hypothetical protein HRT74_06090 [Flavobacteriales bacterium]|nr:hypothetical protein [Flavobacteriales bacterium]